LRKLTEKFLLQFLIENKGMVHITGEERCLLALPVQAVQWRI